MNNDVSSLLRELPEPVVSALGKVGITPAQVRLATDANLDFQGGYAEHWLVVTDVDGDRYEIPDLDHLDPASRARFNRFIYW